MKERIYTIPVNEAFDGAGGKCPFCLLAEKLERDELEIILGASMMEPEIRCQTNELGFCGRHFSMMFEMKNRLGLALMLESHLENLKKDLKTGNMFSKDIGAKSVSRITQLEESCYVCRRTEEKFQKMLLTAAYLFDEEREFREKFGKVGYICLPHYSRLLRAGRPALSKDGYENLVKAANEKIASYLAELKDDISLFCRKFDYRADSEPWGNSKDSVERAIDFLNSFTALR